MNRLADLLLLPTAGALAATALDLGSIAGEYGSSSMPPDTLKIVRLSARRSYVETHLNFANNHECNFDKVMTVEGSDLFYKGPNGEGDACEMRLHFENGKVTFEDRGSRCRVDTCGSRGGYAGTSFALSSRRPVQDRARLLASDAYRDAMKEAGLK